MSSRISIRHRLLTMSLVLLAAVLIGTGSRAVDQEAARPQTHTVLIKGFEFLPPTLEVRSGDTVIWKNEDIVPHTATAENDFDSGGLDKGESWKFVARKKGSFPYICDYHPTMKGSLIVR
ncbi:MAG TPA: cupredoxin family copper-binding protein [Terriglobales bacterium]|nr:cupredoxin family copper-binding protein [Terriglobales bacterium]